MSKTIKFKGFSYEDGKIVNTAYLDGYSFGEKLLEGVMFKCTVLENGELTVDILPEDAEYFNTLNTKKWLKFAYEFAIKYDIFSEKPSGGEDLVLEVAD